jgi:hypothetical protein
MNVVDSMRVRHLPSSECLKENADAKVDAEAAEDGIVHDNNSVKPYRFRDGGSDAGFPNVRLPFAHNEEVREYGEDDISGAPHEGEVCRHGTRLSHVEPEEEANERDDDRVEAPWFCGGGQGFMDGGSVGNTSFRRHRGRLSKCVYGASSLCPPSKTPDANARRLKEWRKLRTISFHAQTPSRLSRFSECHFGVLRLSRPNS